MMPGPGRVIGGMLLAALVASFVLTVPLFVSRLSTGDPWAVAHAIAVVTGFSFVFILLVAFCFGLPAYLLLRRRWTMRWWHAALAGAVLGGATPLLFRGNPSDLLVWAGAGLAGGLAFRFGVGRDPRLPGEAA